MRYVLSSQHRLTLASVMSSLPFFASIARIWLSLHGKKLHEADFIGHASADTLLKVTLSNPQQEYQQSKKDDKHYDDGDEGGGGNFHGFVIHVRTMLDR